MEWGHSSLLWKSKNIIAQCCHGIWYQILSLFHPSFPQGWEIHWMLQICWILRRPWWSTGVVPSYNKSSFLLPKLDPIIDHGSGKARTGHPPNTLNRSPKCWLQGRGYSWHLEGQRCLCEGLHRRVLEFQNWRSVVLFRPINYSLLMGWWLSAKSDLPLGKSRAAAVHSRIHSNFTGPLSPKEPNTSNDCASALASLGASKLESSPA